MGTLTAGQPRLPHYCEHKLPTSCRLSSIGECCACYDNRAHSTTYSTYIDGVGFVSRGTRWQRYCWFCKEFWENRVNAAGLRPAQTQVPHEPDQTAFLEKWYEFHQGYREIQHEDGTIEKVAVLGEDLRDVTPGCLPRTLDELRAGRERSEMAEREEEARQQRQAMLQQVQDDAAPSLEETLDQLFEDATEEERHRERNTIQLPLSHPIPGQHDTGSDNVHAQAMTANGARQSRAYHARRLATLRRALQRMRQGIERIVVELRSIGEDAPDRVDADARLLDLLRSLETVSENSLPRVEEADIGGTTTSQNDRTLTNVQIRLEQAQQTADEARRAREQAVIELDIADREFRASETQLRQIQTERRTVENYTRLFGTREEMVAQGESWVSPIGGMFDRADERARMAEEVRREERTLRRVLEDEEHGGELAARRLAELESRERDVWGVPQNADSGQSPSLSANSRQSSVAQHTSANDPDARAPSQGRYGSPETDLDLRGPEVGLEEYYTLLRRQNWSQEPAGDTTAPDRTRAPGVRIEDTQNRTESASPVMAGPPGQQLDEDPYSNNDRGLDAAFVLSALARSEDLLSFVPWVNSNAIASLLRNVEASSLIWTDRENIESIMELPDVIWETGLPAERNRRRRARGDSVSFTPDAQLLALQGDAVVHDIEVMAECFQMSRRVRECSGLSGPEQLQMLYRLQRGERLATDRGVLSEMLEDESTLARAIEINEQEYNQLNEEQSSRRSTLDDDRRTAARQGNHSRAELDAQRQAARNVALAAGRAAMAVGPTELLERMANRDEQTRAAYQRLQDNGFVPFAGSATMTSRRLRGPFHRTLNLNDFAASPTGSDDEDADPAARGLDAKDSGRPEEPLSEEQMTVVLDCRICYTQKANIITIPCGHLAMCEWCSEQHSPTMAHDRTKPRRAAACPVCRKQIRQKFKVIRG